MGGVREGVCVWRELRRLIMILIGTTIIKVVAPAALKRPLKGQELHFQIHYADSICADNLDALTASSNFDHAAFQRPVKGVLKAFKRHLIKDAKQVAGENDLFLELTYRCVAWPTCIS